MAGRAPARERRVTTVEAPRAFGTGARWLGWSVLAAMLGMLVHAFHSGDFGVEGAALLAMPWGRATVVEVYAGIGLFAGWIVYRERSRMVAALWIGLICLAGNAASALYVLAALRASGGDPCGFWMGARRPDHGSGEGPPVVPDPDRERRRARATPPGESPPVVPDPDRERRRAGATPPGEGPPVVPDSDEETGGGTCGGTR